MLLARHELLRIRLIAMSLTPARRPIVMRSPASARTYLTLVAVGRPDDKPCLDGHGNLLR